MGIEQDFPQVHGSLSWEAGGTCVSLVSGIVHSITWVRHLLQYRTGCGIAPAQWLRPDSGRPPEDWDRGLADNWFPCPGSPVTCKRCLRAKEVG